MNLVVRSLGRAEYRSTWEAMQRFTDGRGEMTVDEVWILEHPPVYTLGLNGKPEHILDAENIPVIRSDRGGQVTYHGPGQLILYALIDVKRRGLGVRALVSALENVAIDTLRQYGIEAHARPEAPGVYVGEAKIASVGIRIRRGCSYHGLSLNVAMDLAPFRGINPCGYPDLQVTSLADLGGPERLREVAVPLIAGLMKTLGYSRIVTPGAVV